MAGGDWKEMFQAAERGDIPLLEYHLEHGVDPNYQHPEFMSTPLVASIVAGKAEVADCLLRHGADPTLRSEWEGLTPMEAAKKHQREAVVAMLEKSLRQPKSNSKGQAHR